MKKSVFVFLLTLPLVALSGTSGDFPIEVIDGDDGSGQAFGSLTSARYSDNDIELIGCGIFNPPGARLGFCQARTANDDYRLCTTTDPVLMSTLSVLSSSSYINFRWDANGECTNIGISTQSSYLPENNDATKSVKKKKKKDKDD